MHAVIIEARVIEIAEHRLGGCMLHGELVLRAAPKLRFGAVTASAGLAADEGGRRNRGGAAGGNIGPAAGQKSKCQAARDDDRYDRRRNDDRPPRYAPRRRVALPGAARIDIPWRSGRSLRSAVFLRPLLGTTHAVTARARDRSLQIVHSPGGGERPRAPCAMSLGVEPLGACQRRRECRFRPLLGASDRGRRRLIAQLCANRLRRHGSGIRIPRRLAHRLLELRNLAGAGTSMH
jgi:hypothetical protein